MNHHQSFSPEAFERLYAMETNYFWFRARNELIGWVFFSHFSSGGGFLEIGCGNGVVLNHLKHLSPQTFFVGSDLFMEGLQFARKRLKGVDLVQMDILESTFRTNFDGVGLFDVLEHIHDDELALRNIFSMLKPGGVFLVAVPQHPSLWSVTDEMAHHKRRYTRNELLRKLEKAGFKVCAMTSFMTFLCPLMVASRWAQRLRGQNNNFNEFAIPDWLNKFFYRICILEQTIIKRGFTMPFGGSLMAIARKAE